MSPLVLQLWLPSSTAHSCWGQPLWAAGVTPHNAPNGPVINSSHHNAAQDAAGQELHSQTRTPKVGIGSFSNSGTWRFLIHLCLKGFAEHSWGKCNQYHFFFHNSHIIIKAETIPARDLSFWWRPQYHSPILHNPPFERTAIHI